MRIRTIAMPNVIIKTKIVKHSVNINQKLEFDKYLMSHE